jgi:hypothetical protein
MMERKHSYKLGGGVWSQEAQAGLELVRVPLPPLLNSRGIGM